VAARLDGGVTLASALDAERESAQEERRAVDARIGELERERTALLADREWLRGRLDEVQTTHDAAVDAMHRAWEEITRLTAEAERERAARAVVEGSRSWRLTAPLRAMKSRFRHG
jgi:chromosome segregation ATPase